MKRLLKGIRKSFCSLFFKKAEMKELKFFVLAIAVAFMIVTGCGENTDKIVAVTEVKLNKSALTLQIDQKESLQVTVIPTDATNPTVSWSSSSDAVASVSQTGEVTAIKEGFAIITVTTKEGNKTATCSVTVLPELISVTDVALDKSTMTLQVTRKENLRATVIPADATDKTVSWSSSDETVAIVSQTGEVTAIKEGVATITVTTANGNKTATCTVTVVLDYLSSFNDLKTYINRSASPIFKLGSGVLLNDYIAKGDIYKLLTANFDQITLGNEMKHDAIVQSNGELKLTNVANLLTVAKDAGISVYGHTLVWHAQQRANYLKGLIAPAISLQDNLFEPNLIENSDFETNIDGWNSWGSNNPTRGRTEEGEGYGGGHALWLTNPVASTSWFAQLACDFSTALQNGSRYVLHLNVKGSKAGAITVAMQNPDTYAGAGSFGVVNITESWSEVTLITTITGANAKRFIFDCGEFDGTIYLDNVTLRRVKPGTSDSQLFAQKTAAEKNEILTAELGRWIKGVMEVAGDYVKRWDVMNEPMSDWPDPYQLKTTPANPGASDFYWQDYLGKDVAVKAIQFARQYGGSDLKLFINDYGLEGGNLGKCRGLIQYIAYIESKGVKVDGIGTQMHISLDTNKDNIVQMYQLLAATGKLVQITELDIGLGGNPAITTPNATEANYQAQADLYRFVVEKYFELVPAPQRAGITVWSPFDSPAGSGWRANEPVGLWTLNHVRKPAYAGFAEGLQAGK
jgi:GH35 family endo-1,4-beta-xylanase